jgi:hypothetical protein
MNAARLADARGGFVVLDCGVSLFLVQVEAPPMALHSIARRRLGSLTLERVLVLAAIVGIVSLVLVSLL